MRPEHGCSGNDREMRFWAGRILEASMRPEHGCSGNERRTAVLVRFLLASMRPEHGCSGNELETIGDDAPKQQLQ